ncbi:hypothetical protein C8J56DRAFT_953021 [Mycena floridula]|nr:hypothetical protein C8J56DRAFT_953021 [Mycena floridula]
MHWIPTMKLAISQSVACLICCSLLSRLICHRRGGESVYRIVGHRLRLILCSSYPFYPMILSFDIIAYISAEPSLVTRPSSLIPRQGLVSRSMPNCRCSNPTMAQGPVD